MTKSVTYSLWLEPSGDIAYRLKERIKSLSKKYSTPLFEPHLTLLGGLTSSPTELISLTNTLASSLQPFELILTKADHRKEFFRSLFIHIKDTRKLKEIRMTACHLFDKPNEDFLPHLSLLYGDLSPKEKGRILNINGREFYTAFTVKSLTLMQTDGMPDQWKRIHAAVFNHQ